MVSDTVSEARWVGHVVVPDARSSGFAYEYRKVAAGKARQARNQRTLKLAERVVEF